MPSDPYKQREDELAAEDEADEKRTHAERLERQREYAGHLEVLADALTTPGLRAPIGYDPADGGRTLSAPVREYRCREPEHELRVFVIPKAVKDRKGSVTAYHYPVADGPFCVHCGRLMERVHRDPVSDS